jgi:hypothetical protein
MISDILIYDKSHRVAAIQKQIAREDFCGQRVFYTAEVT